MPKQLVIYTLHNSFPNLSRKAAVRVLKAHAFPELNYTHDTLPVLHTVAKLIQSQKNQ
jgi:hypothetical protein